MPYVGKKPADIIATSVDTDTGAFSGNVTAGGTLGVTGAVTANAGVVVDNITIDGTEIDLSSGDFTLDVASTIILDADGGEISFYDGGTAIGKFQNSSSDFQIGVIPQDKDIKFFGNDGGGVITALTLDMSDAGTAIFNHDISLADNSMLKVGAGNDLALFHDGNHSYIDEGGTGELRLKTNGTAIRFQHGDETMSLYTADGSVELFHDDSKRFETTSRSVTATSETVGVSRYGGSTTVTLADDASLNILGSGVAGSYIVNVYETGNGVGGSFFVTFRGTGTLLASGLSGDCSASDVDGDLCLISTSGSHTVSIKNRLGASKTIGVTMYGVVTT